MAQEPGIGQFARCLPSVAGLCAFPRPYAENPFSRAEELGRSVLYRHKGIGVGRRYPCAILAPRMAHVFSGAAEKMFFLQQDKRRCYGLFSICEKWSVVRTFSIGNDTKRVDGNTMNFCLMVEARFLHTSPFGTPQNASSLGRAVHKTI